MAPRSLWTEIRPHLRDPDGIPEWLTLCLQHIRFGRAVRVPEAGRLPPPVLRARARELVCLRIEQGHTKREAIRMVAQHFGVNRRTVERWVKWREPHDPEE